MYNIFLDDERKPKDVTWLDLPLVNWTIVRSYKQFVELINKNCCVPKLVSFDHDLGESSYQEYLRASLMGRTDLDYNNIKEKTGLDCAKFLVDYCMKQNVKHPPYLVHSLNIIGAENIRSYIESYNKSL